MPTSKEVLALRWAEKSEEEKNLIRMKNAERIRKLRANKVQKKRSEMSPDELEKVRALDKYKKIKKRKNMTDEQKKETRVKDKERKAQKRSLDKKNETKKKTEENKKVNTQKYILMKGKNKLKQLSNNCRIQQKIRAKRTTEEIDYIQEEKAEDMKEKRSKMTKSKKMLARTYAREGMREHRRFGFLREYKQRKRRFMGETLKWKEGENPLNEYFEKVKEVETADERKEELKRMNKIRVQRHRMKVKRMLQEPITIGDYGEKGPYELLREKNIQEFEKLKRDSGLFY